MKVKVKSYLAVLAIIGLLAIAVSSSGCTTPLPTKMTITWHSTAAKLKPGGLTVSGQLLVDPSDTGNFVAFGCQTITLKGIYLQNPLDASSQQTVDLQQTTTDNNGNFAFTIGARDDKYLLYAAGFELAGYQSKWSVVGGYLGMTYGDTSLAKNIAKLPRTVSISGGKNALLGKVALAQAQVLSGKYSAAAVTMDAVLAKLDTASAVSGAPQTLLNADYTAYLLARNCHWLSGEPWVMPDRSAPDNYSP